MPLDASALTPLDPSGLTELDTSELKPLDVSGLTAVSADRPPVEDSWTEIGRKLLRNAPTMFKQAGGGLLQMMAESDPTPPASAGISPTALWWQDSVVKPHREIVAAAREAGKLPGQRIYDEATADLQANSPNVGDDLAKRYAYDISQGIVQMIPSVAATLVTRQPAVGATIIGGQVIGPRYAESREAGRNQEQSFADASFYAAAEAIPEMIPLGILMRPGQSFLGRTFAAAGAEGVQEMLTQAVQTGYDAGVLGEEMTWREARDAIIHAGIVGAGVGTGLAVGTAPFVRREPESDAGQDQGVPEGAVPAEVVLGEVESVSESPIGEREQARAETPPPTQADIDSPIPTDLIQEGREVLQDAVGEQDAARILAEAGFPAINSRIRVDGNEVMVVDAYEQNGERGAKYQFPNGTIVAESFSALTGRVSPAEGGGAQTVRSDQVQPAETGPQREGEQAARDLQQAPEARATTGQAQEETTLDTTGLTPVEASTVEATPQGPSVAVRGDTTTGLESTDTSERFSLKKPWYFSSVERAAQSLKQAKGQPQQMLAMLKKSPGVKAEELEWIGVEDWLNAYEGTVTKEEIVEFVVSNGVRVEEVQALAASKTQAQRNAKINESIKPFGYRYDRYDGEDLFFAEDNVGETSNIDDWMTFRELPEEVQQAVQFASSSITTVSPKYKEYTLPGGTNYREVLLTLPAPDIDPNAPGSALASRDAGVFQGGHWNQPNVLAHLRLKDRVSDDGKKVLFIEEIQSDWHAEGRRQGYDIKKPTLDDARKFFDIDTDVWSGLSDSERQSYLEEMQSGEPHVAKGRVPDAPFKGNAWVELTAKRAIRMAAEEGYDAIAWTTGDQQADRYDLSEEIREIAYWKDNGGWGLSAESISGEYVLNQNFVNSKAELESVVGKEIAQRIIDNEGDTESITGFSEYEGIRFLTGENLRIGGEGMKNFYDKVIPNVFRKVTKKLDKSAAIEPLELTVDSYTIPGRSAPIETKYNFQSLPITDAIRGKAMGGLPLFALRSEFTARSDALEADLKSRLKQVGIADQVAVKLVDTIRAAAERRSPREPEKKVELEEKDITLYRATIHKNEEGIPLGSHWSEDKEVAEAYQDNPGFGGPYLREIKTRGSVLDITDGLKSLAEFLNYSDPYETAAQWRYNGWRYPWEESGEIAEKIENSGYDFLKYEDDFPEGAITYRRLTPSDGMPTGAQGRYFKRLIEVAADTRDGMWVMDHEVIHALRDLGVVRAPEWRALSRAATARIDEVRERYQGLGLTEEQLVEEAIADMHADWATGQREAKGFMRTAFERIRDFLQALGNSLRGMGFQSAGDIFRRIDRGEMGRRGNIVDGAREADVGRLSLRPTDLDPTTAGGTENRQKAANRWYDSQPLDRAFRLPWQLFGGINERGEWKPGLQLSEKTGDLIKNATFDDAGRFAWLNPMLYKARAGLIDRYGLDPDYVERERQRSLDERRIMAQVPEIMDRLRDSDIGPVEAKVLQSVLTGEAVADAEMAKLAEPIRNAIDDMGAEAVELGLLSADAFERNRGAYLHRVYLKHENDQGALGRWVSGMSSKRRKKIIGSQFKGRGLWIEVSPGRVMRNMPNRADNPALEGERFRVLDKVNQEASDKLREVDPPSQRRVQHRVYLPEGAAVPSEYSAYQDRGVWEVRGRKGANLVLWRDFTKPEREKMGEIVDARYTISKTYMQMAHDLATGRFFNDISINEDWSRKDEPPDGTWKNAEEYSRFVADQDVEWVRVPDTVIAKSRTKRYGALAGSYVRAEIWRDLAELEQIQRPNLWTKLLTQWKVNKTGRSPVVHMNNVMSNVMLMDLADVRVSDLARGIRSMIRSDKDYQEALENGAFGADMVSQEIRRNTLQPLLEDLEREIQGGKDSMEARIGLVGRLADTIWSRIKGLDRGLVNLYRLEDEVFRMATYMRNIDRGLTPSEAALDARDQFLNYDIRAPWVNAARRSVLPFISYTYRAVPVIARSVALRPWKLAKYLTVWYVANSLSYMFEPGDEEEERRSLRDTEQGRTWIGAPRMIRMPFSDSYGNPVFLDIRRWIPAGDVFDMNQGHGAFPVPSPLQFGGPMMLAAELMLNKQAFTGKEITNDRTDDWWDRSSKIGDWAWKSWMPSAAWIPGSWYWERIGNAITGARDYEGRPYELAQAIPSAFGVKLKPQDVEEAFFWKGVEFERVERELRAALRSNGQDYERGLISRSTYERREQKIREKFAKLERERDETFTSE